MAGINEAKLFEKLEEIQEEQRKTNQALFGDEQLGLKGLVAEMAELKEWRAKVMLNAAAISGGATVVMFLTVHFGLKLMGL